MSHKKNKNKNSHNKTNNKTNINKEAVEKTSINNNLISNLKSKYKIDELNDQYNTIDNQLINKKETKEITIQKPEVVNSKRLDELKNEEIDQIGWKKPKVLLRNLVYGIFMGVSDGIPGYSGGTTLSIIGFYDELIKNIRSFFSTKTNFFKVNLKYFLWFLPFLITWIGAFIGLNFIVDLASDHNYGVVFVFLFGFFALFSIPLFYIKNKDVLINYKFFYKELKSDKSQKWMLILIAFGFVLMISFALMARFIPSTGGVSFLTDEKNSGRFLDPNNFDTNRIILWLVASYFAGIAMMIPGVSGGIILYVFNVYPQLNYAISNVFNDANFIPYIVIIILGAVLGIITSVFLINKLTSRWNKQFMNFCLGLVLGSFITIFVSLSANDYATLDNTNVLGISIGMIFVALIINVAIFIALNETKKINYPRLRLFNKKATNNPSK